MRRGAVIACCAPAVLLAVDFAVLSVVVPQMETDLAMARAQSRWLFSAYSLAFGCLLLVAGRAADALGRRRMLVGGLVVFAAGATVTALAATGTVAIAGRAVQGAGAATMTPAALSLMTATTSEGDERNRVLAAYGLAIAAGFVAGTLISGVVATVADWRPAVAASSVLAALAALASWCLLPRDVAAHGPRTQTPTFAVVVLVAVAALGAAVASPAGLVVAAAATGMLVVLAARIAGGSRRMAVACSAGLVVTGTGAAATLLLTLHLQDGQGYSPLGAGLVLACFGVAAVPGARVARRVAPGAAVAVGLAVQGAALLLAVAAGGSAAAIVASVAGFGFGHVIGNASVAEVATTGAAAARHGAIVGMLVTAQYLGGTLGPSLLGRASFQTGMAAAGGIALATAAAAWWSRAAT